MAERGTCIAWNSTMARISLALVICMGCLVTENAQIPEEPNYPPSIVSAPEAAELGVALDQIVRINLDEFEGSELVLPVVIRDPNLNQPLEFQVYLDFNGNPFETVISEPNSVVAPTGMLARSLSVRVPRMRLIPGSCQKVELRVSSQFENDPILFRNPVEPEDFDQAVWWLRVVDSESPLVDLDSCR